ncbi:hypothetical protein BKA81DRAFT_167718 [Phyllosticta paracitricarpa]
MSSFETPRPVVHYFLPSDFRLAPPHASLLMSFFSSPTTAYQAPRSAGCSRVLTLIWWDPSRELTRPSKSRQGSLIRRSTEPLVVCLFNNIGKLIQCRSCITGAQLLLQHGRGVTATRVNFAKQMQTRKADAKRACLSLALALSRGPVNLLPDHPDATADDRHGVR